MLILNAGGLQIRPSGPIAQIILIIFAVYIAKVVVDKTDNAY